MADLDEEFARFQAEIASVEQEVAEETADPAAAAQVLPPPLAPPPVAPPALAPPPLAPPPLAPPPLAPPPLAPPPLAPPPLAPPPVPAPTSHPPQQHHAAAGYHQHPPAAAESAHSHRLHLLQQQQLFQQQQQQYHQQQQQQHTYAAQAQPSAAAMAGPSTSSMAAAGAGGAPPGLRTGAPADEATLRRLKEDLLQQHQDKGKGAKKGMVRMAAGEKWFDPTLGEWPDNDHRIFVGDLGNEVNDELLSKAFQKYPSFAKAKVVRDKRTNKSKGYGFVSFLDGNDFAKAMREMNGKYIGNRPCKLRKSTWEERTPQQAGGKRKHVDGGGAGPKHKNHISIAPRLLQQWEKQ